MKRLNQFAITISLFLSSQLAIADSFELSSEGSNAISNGVLEASAGSLQIVTGVLSVPITISEQTADWSQQAANQAQKDRSAPLPIADQLIQFVDSPHE